MRHIGKWDSFGTSIFSLMTGRANAAGAVNLAQGFPDFDGPDVIKQAAIKAIQDGAGMNQYAPSVGLPKLRQLLASRQAEKSGRLYDWDSEVTVCAGATEAIYSAMQALLLPGDEVLALAPYFDCYPAAAFAAGAKLIGVPLKGTDFQLDATSLAAAITPNTRLMIINTPHNPSGRVFSAAELAAVAALAVKHDLLVITDEVYEEIVFRPARHIHLATLPGMAERTIVISSTAKTYSYTGWKVGYAFAPPRLSQALRAVHQFTVFCAATPLQAGMIAALSLPESYYEDLRGDYQSRRDHLLATLTAAGFRAEASAGTYFILADYSGLRAPTHETDLAFADWLTATAKVACIPISVFYDDAERMARSSRYVRFAFCKDLRTLEAARLNLLQLASK